MNGRWLEGAAVAVGVVYLTLIVVAMNSLSFDIWGALLLIPIYGVLGFALINTMFPGPLAGVRKALYWGLGLKLVGAAARYWVGFEAYEGGIDAAAYHQLAREEAGEIWSGERPFFDAIPSGTGTEFTEAVTAFLYTVTGGSQLAGFVTFSFLAFVGVACFVRAALTALPDMAAHKYAWLCAIAPSLVYWPSSIGKEALVIFGLGTGTLGIARLVSGGRRLPALALMLCGLGFAGLVRPHMAGIWIAATLPALVLSVIRGTGTADGRRGGRLGLALVLLGSAVGLAIIAGFTLRFLQPRPDGDQTLTELFAETTRRTSQAGSNFVPPAIDSPRQWPFAIVRTLLRPLPFEARGLAQLVSATEIVALLAVYAYSWKRVKRVLAMVTANPYVLFAVTAVALTGLAFASFANLGVLTRQKSLLFPLLLLIPCLPLAPSAVAPRQKSGLPDHPAASTTRTPPALAGRNGASPDPQYSDRVSDHFWDPIAPSIHQEQ